MKIFFLYFLIISFLSINNELLSLNAIRIPEGVYNLILKKRYSSISYNKKLTLSKDKLGSDSFNFRVNLYQEENNPNTTYYTLEHVKTKLYLGIKTNSNDSKIDSIIFNKEIIQNETLSFIFNFSRIQDSIYVIQSEKGCLLKEENQNIICAYETPLFSSHFHLLKLFSEVKKIKTMN